MSRGDCFPLSFHTLRLPRMDLQQKLTILADAAKYDASCASSGTTIRNSRQSGGLWQMPAQSCDRSIPAASSARLKSRPAGPTKGFPVRSS
ncbi:MAG TPA: hypothetical protein VHO24_00075 [Opitutaceae bacterium]|nr:hypothetical protein [Opitutaceae bacterium]